MGLRRVLCEMHFYDQIAQKPIQYFALFTLYQCPDKYIKEYFYCGATQTDLQLFKYHQL